MVSVTFDSNVWEQIVDDDKRYQSTIYQSIFDRIKSGDIEPFFFEGLAVLESIPKKDRKEFFGNFKASISFQVDDDEPHVTEGSSAPGLTDYLQEVIPKALKLGFKFIHTPRIGAPSLNLPNQYKAKDSKYTLSERLDRTFDCLRFIESLGAGKARIHARLDSDSRRGIVNQTKEDESLSQKQYAKDVGEWVDGDAIAGHYGFGVDYFCTNDQAKGAGSSSIFHSDNLCKLSEKYDIKVISPAELLELIIESADS
ncbi:hypothetical protein [Grimontia sp. SpTr1]|uniref:hypothetical protein n=1 Tax=Grimontia sp. SpTr1 TaxID=2995319 RepID=UPI00248CDFD1|nr:hypothetical protein [Grimontia sp. SpTr1]